MKLSIAGKIDEFKPKQTAVALHDLPASALAQPSC